MKDGVPSENSEVGINFVFGSKVISIFNNLQLLSKSKNKTSSKEDGGDYHS